MKFLGQRPARDNEDTIYDFCLGSQELRLIYDCLRDAHGKLPKILAIQTTRHRLSSMVKEFELQVRANKIKK